jgi:hypothetical protein
VATDDSGTDRLRGALVSSVLALAPSFEQIFDRDEPFQLFIIARLLAFAPESKDSWNDLLGPLFSAN